MKLFRLINKPIADMVDEESFFTHRLMLRSHKVSDIVNFVERSKQNPDYLSVITTDPGRSLTMYGFTDNRWKR